MPLKSVKIFFYEKCKKNEIMNLLLWSECANLLKLSMDAILDA